MREQAACNRHPPPHQGFAIEQQLLNRGAHSWPREQRNTSEVASAMTRKRFACGMGDDARRTMSTKQAAGRWLLYPQARQQRLRKHA